VVAQSLDQLQAELRSRYLGNVLVFDHPYGNREQVYDLDGNLQGLGVPVCPDPYRRFHVDKVTLTRREVRLEGRRGLTEILFSSHPVPKHRPRPEPLVVHIKSDGKPWDQDRVLAAVESMQHPKIDSLGASLPEGAAPPAPGSDPRILYELPDGPVYRAEKGISKPRATYAPDPEFTDAARKEKIQGMVRLSVVIGADGLPELVVPGKRLGYGLDEAAIAKMKTWRFEPARLDGKPVRVAITVETSFCLY